MGRREKRSDSIPTYNLHVMSTPRNQPPFDAVQPGCSEGLNSASIAAVEELLPDTWNVRPLLMMYEQDDVHYVFGEDPDSPCVAVMAASLVAEHRPWGLALMWPLREIGGRSGASWNRERVGIYVHDNTGFERTTVLTVCRNRKGKITGFSQEDRQVLEGKAARIHGYAISGILSSGH